MKFGTKTTKETGSNVAVSVQKNNYAEMQIKILIDIETNCLLEIGIKTPIDNRSLELDPRHQLGQAIGKISTNVYKSV